MLEVLIPEAVIAVVVGEVIDAAPVLLILVPLAVIAFAIGEGIDAMALAFAFHVVAFIDVPVFENRLSPSVGLAAFHLAGIDRTVLERACTYLDFRREDSLQLAQKAFLLLLLGTCTGGETQGQCKCCHIKFSHNQPISNLLDFRPFLRRTKQEQSYNLSPKTGKKAGFFRRIFFRKRPFLSSLYISISEPNPSTRPA